MENQNKNTLNYQDLCIFCFDTLVDHLKKTKLNIEFPNGFKNKSFPLFVTWTMGEEKELRGCIGTFAEEKLELNLKKYALISALKDTRFSPISLKEVSDLHVGVSLLTEFEECGHALDWEVGKHGIEIDFEHRDKNYGATFLPEVAEEQGWNQNETLIYLVNKAGFKGKLETVIEKIKTKRYQSVKSYLSFDEYTEMKKNNSN